MLFFHLCRFRWLQLNSYFEESQCTVEWTIPADTKPGTYRIRHIGHKKSLHGVVSRYESLSSTFLIKSSKGNFAPSVQQTTIMWCVMAASTLLAIY